MLMNVEIESFADGTVSLHLDVTDEWCNRPLPELKRDELVMRCAITQLFEAFNVKTSIKSLRVINGGKTKPSGDRLRNFWSRIF